MSNLTNFSNVFGNGFGFNGTAPTIPGLGGSFGGAGILGIVGIILIIVIGVKYKASPDLIVLSVVTMMAIEAGIYLPEWSYVLFIMGGGAVFGLGLLKVLRH